MTRALVQYSTGAGSAMVAYRAVEQYGVDSVLLMTARRNGNCYCGRTRTDTRRGACGCFMDEES